MAAYFVGVCQLRRRRRSHHPFPCCILQYMPHPILTIRPVLCKLRVKSDEGFALRFCGGPTAPLMG